MGIVISRFKAKPSTVEILESLEKDIQSLEEFRVKNQRVLKLWVGRLLLYSSVLYLVTCITVYLWCLPEQWTERLVLALPFFIFPILVWFLRKLLIFLFSKRTERNNEKLDELKSQKKKILEEVMERETYKNAKLILERFDPESKKKPELEAAPVGPQATPRPGQEVRQRNMTPRTPVVGTPSGPAARPPLPPGATPSSPLPLAAPGGPPEKTASSVAAQHSLMRRPASPGMQPPGPPLARPILPRERGIADRLIEYLVGDGPQNRYALVCQQCFSHNGMALKEEFEYIAFRCAYCYVLNPARKTRPQAPRLPEFSFEKGLRSEPAPPEPSSSSSSEVAEEPTATVSPAEPGGLELQEQPSQEDSATAERTGTPESEKTPSEKSEEEKDVSHMEVD